MKDIFSFSGAFYPKMCIGPIPSKSKSMNKSLYSFPYQQNNYIYFDLEFTCNNICIVRVKNGNFFINTKRFMDARDKYFSRSIHWGVFCDLRGEPRETNYYHQSLRWVGQYSKRGLWLCLYQWNFDQTDRGISERVWSLQYQSFSPYRQEILLKGGGVMSHFPLKLIFRFYFHFPNSSLNQYHFSDFLFQRKISVEEYFNTDHNKTMTGTDISRQTKVSNYLI